MTRWNSLDEFGELLTRGLIGKSTRQGVERPKFQPASALCAGDLDGTAQRGDGGCGLSAAMSQLTINSPELGLKISLVVAV
jgi:hypothetical protein